MTARRKFAVFVIAVMCVFIFEAYVNHQSFDLKVRMSRASQKNQELHRKEEMLIVEIERLCPPQVLYEYWKTNCPHLVFYQADQKQEKAR